MTYGRASDYSLARCPWLKRQFPADQGVQVSHETIYRSLFIQTRGVLKKELMAHLRTARQMRQAKGGTTKSGLGQIVDTVSIRERPAEAEERAVPGAAATKSRLTDC
jgi:IS30 family transposase